MDLINRLQSQASSKTSHITACMKASAGASEDPTVWVKDLITDIVNRLRADLGRFPPRPLRLLSCSSLMDLSKRHVPTVPTVQKTVEIHKFSSWTRLWTCPLWCNDRYRWSSAEDREPQLQFIDKVVDTVAQRQSPVVQTVQKTKEILQLQNFDKMGRSCRFHRCRSWRRQSRIPIYRSLRKWLRSLRSRRSRAPGPLRFWALHLSAGSTGGNCGRGRDRSASSRRILTIHVR